MLFGACREGSGPPYGPVTDALEHLLAHADDLGIVDADAERARTLLQADRDDEHNTHELSFGQDPRIAHFHAVTDLVVDAGRRAPVLFVLDDLQWAGRPTLQLVLHWFRSPLPLRLCLVATHRETRPTSATPSTSAGRVPPARGHHARAGRRLRPSWRRRSSSRPRRAPRSTRYRPAPIEVLAQQTDGNPFLLGELWRHFIETGALVREGGSGAPADPRRVRQPRERAIGRRPAHRPAAADGARELLDIAAVAGSTFTVDLLATVTGTERGAVLELLEPAIASATIDELGPGAFGFAHTLVLARDLRPHDDVAARRAPSRTSPTRIERRTVTDRSLSDLARHYAAAVPIADRGDRGRGGRASRRCRDARHSRSKTPTELLLRVRATRVRARLHAPSCSSASPRASCPPATPSSALGHLQEAAGAGAGVRTAATSRCAPRSRSRKPAGGWACPATRPRRSCARR